MMVSQYSLMQERIPEFIRGDEAERPQSGESSASQQNSDISLIMDETLRDVKRRLEDLEDAGVSLKPIPPIDRNTELPEVIDKVNYIIQAFNNLISKGQRSYL